MTQETNIYEEPPSPAPAELEEAIAADAHRPLKRLVIGVSMNWEDLSPAEAVCERLSHHPQEVVRGDVILGLGQLIRAGLNDPSPCVRGQSWDAACDVEHFLGWKVTATECNTVPEGIIPVNALDDRGDDEEDNNA